MKTIYKSFIIFVSTINYFQLFAMLVNPSIKKYNKSANKILFKCNYCIFSPFNKIMGDKKKIIVSVILLMM